jgi:hypothetical protein
MIQDIYKLLFLSIGLTLSSCGYIYKTEESLRHQLSYFVGKSQTFLIQYWGKPIESQPSRKENRLIYIKQAKDYVANLSKEAYYQNGCIFNFSVKNNIVVSFEYNGRNCYGLSAVSIISNWR